MVAFVRFRTSMQLSLAAAGIVAAASIVFAYSVV